MPEYYRSGRLASVAAAAFAAGLLAGPGWVYAAGLSCTGLPAVGAVTSNPISCTVNCSAGGKLASAVALKPRTTSRLTITIKGTCVESVDPLPSSITLQGASTGGTLQAPKSTTDPVLGIGGIGVDLDDLTITGGLNAVRGHSGSAFTGNNLVVEKASNANVLLNHSVVTLNTSTIENSANDGIQSFWQSTVFLNGGTVQNNAVIGVHAADGGGADIFGGAVVQNNGVAGVQAIVGGAATVSAATITKNGFGTGGVGGINSGTGGHVLVTGDSTRVSANNFNGIFAFGGSANVAGGAVIANNSGNGLTFSEGAVGHVTDTIVEGNSGTGIYNESGVLHIGDSSGPVLVQKNKVHGIFMRTNAVVVFADPTNIKIINNTGWGILCAAAPANPLIFGTVGTVSGNTVGQISCKTSP